MINDHQTAAIRDALTEAVKAGIGHAITLIGDYAARHPEATHHCDQLCATLRHQTALLGMETPK